MERVYQKKQLKISMKDSLRFGLLNIGQELKMRNTVDNQIRLNNKVYF
jgi:hypothetical protein